MQRIFSPRHHRHLLLGPVSLNSCIVVVVVVVLQLTLSTRPATLVTNMYTEPGDQHQGCSLVHTPRKL